MLHCSSTLQFDLILENELFAFTLFLMGINDSVTVKSVFEHFVGANSGGKRR